MTLRRFAILAITSLPVVGQSLVRFGTLPDPQTNLHAADPVLDSMRHFVPAGQSFTAPAEAALAARLSRHAVPDAVFLAGGLPYLVAAPRMHRGMTALPPPAGQAATGVTGVNAMAVLRGLGRADGLESNLDAIALAGQNGLWIWRRPTGRNDSIELTQVGGAEWNGTQLLAVHRDDPSVIFGVDPNHVLRIATRHPATGVFTTSSTSVALGSTVNGIAAVRWDAEAGAAHADCAVIQSRTLRVYERTGALLHSFNEPNGAAALGLTVARTSLGEKLCAFFENLGGGVQLYAFDEGREGEPAEAVLSIDLAAVTAGDLTNDGWEDLVLSSKRNTELLVLMHTDLAGVFAEHPALAFEIRVAVEEPTRADNQSPAAVADFDGDGDTDLLVAVGAHAGAAVPEAHFLRILSKVGNVTPPATTAVAGVENIPQDTYTYTLTFTPAAVGTHTEMIVWPQDPFAFYRIFAAPEVRVVQPRTTGSNSISVTLSRSFLNDAGSGIPGVYAYLLRPVDIDAAGIVTWAGPPECGAIFGPNGQNQAMQQIPVGQDPPPPQPVIITPTRVGGVGVRVKIPPPPPGEVPEPLPPPPGSGG